MMTDYSELIQRLNTKLTEFEYESDLAISIPSIRYISYIKKTSIFKVKNLCAMVDVPDNIVDILTVKRFLEFLKKSLLDQYGDAFLWKELEMCLVVLCDDKMYKILKKDEGAVMCQASFSLNALLGTCFINKETFDSFAVSTWGIYFSGDHFKAVSELVSKWCQNQKAGFEGNAAA